MRQINRLNRVAPNICGAVGRGSYLMVEKGIYMNANSKEVILWVEYDATRLISISHSWKNGCIRNFLWLEIISPHRGGIIP